MTIAPDGAPALKRSMHSLGALMITLSGLSPSIGVFIVGSEILRQAGSGIFLCFVLAALLGVAMACVYAELASAFPETGGEYTIVGRTLGPTFGFAALGLNLAGFTIAQALSGLGVATYLQVILPGLTPVPTAIALVIAATGVAVLNLRVSALVTGGFLALEMLSLIVLSVLGFAHPHRGLAQALHPVTLGGGGMLIPTTLAVMGTATAGAIYAFNGYGSVVALGEELHDAPARIAGVVFRALGLAAVFQVIPVLAVIMGTADLGALIASPAPLPAFIHAAGGAWLGGVMSLSIAVAIFNAMIAVSLMAGRQLYATGRDGVWGARLDKPLTRLHPRFHSPLIATVAMGGISMAWCFVPLPILVTLIASGIVFIYSGLCLAALVGRRNGVTARAGFRMPLFPLAPVVALLAMGGVLWTSLTDAVAGRPGVLASVALVVGSAAAYRVLVRPSGRWAQRGPSA